MSTERDKLLESIKTFKMFVTEDNDLVKINMKFWNGEESYAATSVIDTKKPNSELVNYFRYECGSLVEAMLQNINSKSKAKKED